MSDLHLLRPEWLLALPPLLALLWYWHHRQRRDNPFVESIDAALLDVLLEPQEKRRSSLRSWLLGSGLVLALLALSGPAWERTPQPVSRDSDALVLVLDLSLSMYVRDVEPTRLVRARQKLADLLRLRRQGYTALVAYAGDAYTVAPLTDDSDTIANLLGSLAPNMMPVLGSDPDRAIALARTLLEGASISQGRILLITDGVDRLNDVSQYRSRSFPISVLAIGTDDGGPIPLDFANQPGRVLENNGGSVVRARLDEPKLRELAELCYGRYALAGQTDRDLEYLLATPLPDLEAVTATDRQFDQWADQGYWLALLLLPLLALAFRRGLFVASAGAFPLAPLLLVLSLGVCSEPANAGLWDDLWARPDQQARRALREGAPERAATLFKDPGWNAVAQYRSRNYSAALDAFEAEQNAPTRDLKEQQRRRYNEGNALARLSQFEQAIERYDQVLQNDPDHADAAHNKALLEKLMENQGQGQGERERGQQEDSDSEQNESGESQGNGDEGRPEQDQGMDSGQPDDGGEDGSESAEEPSQSAGSAQPSDSAADEQEATAGRDATAEAMEQWLRRVPDDPGGLLRRKFQYETNQRRRRGEAVRDQEKIW